MYDVCIIGAGQSGLTTIKTFSDQNIICLEKSSSNGMFQNIKEKNYFEWSSSKYMSAFSDFPMTDLPIWFTIQDYINYLKSYAKHFNLEKFIKYNSTVINCKEFEDGWIVKYENNSYEHEIKCKKLIICSGLNQTPKYPDIVNNFKGEILHTQDIYYMHEYEWFNKFTNKKVFLMGGGESAFDIGHLILNYTKDLYYTTKEYIEWFPKGNDNEKNIIRFEKINNKCLKNVGKIFDYYEYPTPTDTQLLFVEYNLPEIISYIWHEYGRNMIKYVRNINCNNCIHQNDDLCKINKTPNNLFLKYVTKRTDFLLDIYENKVKIVYYPTKIKNKSIETKELNFDVDIIVCSSGYKKYFPFLDSSVYEGKFIKKIIPNNSNNIAFIGFARPTMGSIATIAEVQSWWVKSYFDGMKYKIRKPFFRYYDVLDLSNNNINSLVNGCYYMKDLAKDLKIEPNMVHLFFTDFKLFKNILFSSCYSMIYRIHGQKSYIGSNDFFINNIPKIENINFENNLLHYNLLFLYAHVIYIVFLILLCWILSFFTKISISFIIFIILIYLSYW
jgi:hypothetical protein